MCGVFVVMRVLCDVDVLVLYVDVLLCVFPCMLI